MPWWHMDANQKCQFWDVPYNILAGLLCFHHIILLISPYTLSCVISISMHVGIKCLRQLTAAGAQLYHTL